MGIIDKSLDKGRSKINARQEDLIAQADTSSITLVPGDTAGIEESITDFGFDAQGSIPSLDDFSLTDGFNIDNALNIGGEITKIRPEVINFFGQEFNLDSLKSINLAQQFGLSGLFGAPQVIDTNVQPKMRPSKNILHQYSTYTYKITLGAQTVVEHQETADNTFTGGVPRFGHLLMSSGGARKVDGENRDEIFAEDFYIEDLTLHTLMGTNQAAGANNIKMDFTIFEPYSVSLIERMLALAAKLGYKNYIDIPYIFKIEFIGYDDAGNSLGIIPQTTKYIPFKLLTMKFELRGGQGSIYDCKAMVHNHQTLEETVSTIPESVEIAAGTVGEFFNGKTTGDSANNTTGSLVETVNAFYNKLISSTGLDSKTGSTARNTPDKITINIDDMMANSKINVANLAKVGMYKEGYAGNVHMDPTKPTIGFNAGTHITAIIKEVIKNSTFIVDQLNEAERVDSANAQLTPEEQDRAIKKKPFINFKITTRYKMLKYDEKANRFAYEATYNVTPYEVRGQQSTAMGKTDIDSIVKEYDYLFTGKNQDITELDIQFNHAFYNSMAANTESIGEGTPGANNRLATGFDSGDHVADRSDPLGRNPVNHHPPSARDNIGPESKENRKKIKADAFWKSIMQDSQVDMIKVQMSILGDPAFIKQDDILYKSYGGDTQDGLTENGSIKTDQGDVFVRLKFKAAGDLNHDTGLRFDNQQIPGSLFNHSSAFTGYYKIITIVNKFSDGQFHQELKLLRAKQQEEAILAPDKAATNTLESFNDGLVSIPELTIDSYLNPSVDGLLSDPQLVTELQAQAGTVGQFGSLSEFSPDDLAGQFDLDLDSIVDLNQFPTVDADKFDLSVNSLPSIPKTDSLF